MHHLYLELNLVLWTAQLQCRSFWKHEPDQRVSPAIQPCGRMLQGEVSQQHFPSIPGYFLPKLAELWAGVMSVVGHWVNAALTRVSAAQEMWGCLRWCHCCFISSWAGLGLTWIGFSDADGDAANNMILEMCCSVPYAVQLHKIIAWE